jgi:carboxyl-terminal processing protease
LIVGRRTFGKGLVQRPMPLSDGSEIRLTIARYYTPTGRFIQKPYDDPERYKQDLTQRFLNGEFVNADSIKMPDSLLFKTLITKRTVYGGGGIMPDFFVPLDTTQSSEYYRKLIRGGHINNYSYRFVSSKKTELKKYYPTFTLFNKNFECTKDFMDDFFAYVQKEDSTLIFDEKEYDISKTSITLRLKSIIAQDLWGVSELYQVFNDSNEIVQRALQIISSKEYNSVNLD